MRDNDGLDSIARPGLTIKRILGRWPSCQRVTRCSWISIQETLRKPRRVKDPSAFQTPGAATFVIHPITSTMQISSELRRGLEFPQKGKFKKI